MDCVLRTLAIPSGSSVTTVLPDLAAALAGGSALLPVPADDEGRSARLIRAMKPEEPIDDSIALVVATSGTTGTPKGAMLTADALRASGAATHARLGGPGSWLLALPAYHIAGLQVLLRALQSGTEPTVIDVSRGFTPVDLVAAIAAMPGPRRYTSLVPTQLHKVLDDPTATMALATLDAVLLGGAATPAGLLARASASGIHVVRTYGMSETCGGCVYDGVPLAGVHLRIDAGRVLLGGPMLASGYRNFPDHPAFAEPGWFRTDDAGSLHDGVLTVRGRLDEGISTGGLTVIPQVVEAVLATHPEVRECAVFGVPDPRLGERVVAAVVGSITLDDARAHVSAQLDSSAAPREIHLLDALPLRGPGKVDRAALHARFGRPE